jgi:hypothetical protein
MAGGIPAPTVETVRKAWLAQFWHAGPSEKFDAEAEIDAFLAPLIEPTNAEPAYPLDCSSCGTGYDSCTRLLRRPRGKCCCATCFETATHNQYTWEAWDRRRRQALTKGT